MTEGVAAEELNLSYMWEYSEGEGNEFSHQFLTEGQYLTISQQDFIDYGLSTEGELNCYVNGVYNNFSLYDSVIVSVSQIPNTAPYFTKIFPWNPMMGSH